MGSSATKEALPKEPPVSQAVLERTLTEGAVNVLTAQLRRIRDERAELKADLEDAVQDLELAQELMGRQRKELIFYGGACAIVAAAASGSIAAMVVGRQQRSALARISQDFVDLQRRSAVEVAKAQRYGSQGLVKSLIPALDAMDAACQHASDADSEGIQLTRSTLLSALREHGVEPIAPDVGETFDTSTMEAMFTVPIGDGDQTGNVESVFRPGYSLHGERVLRAAQVGVGVKAEDGEKKE